MLGRSWWWRARSVVVTFGSRVGLGLMLVVLAGPGEVPGDGEVL